MNWRKCFLPIISFFFMFSLLTFFSGEARSQTRTSGRTGLSTQEEDGTPNIFCRRYKVTNGTMTDNGNGSCSIDTGGGGGISASALDIENVTSSLIAGAGTMNTKDTNIIFTVGATPGTADIALGDAITIVNTVTSDGSVLGSPGTITICSSKTSIGDQNCDYITDGTADEVQFQAALADLDADRANFGDIVTTAGTFTFDAPVVISGTASPYVRIGIKCASGWGTTIGASNTFTGNNLFEFTEATNDPTAAFIMENCLLGGNKSNVTIGAFDSKVGGVNNVPLWDLQFHKVIMFSFGSTVITLDNPWGFVFSDSQIEDSDECGIVISQGGTGTGNAKLSGAQIIGSKIIQNGQDASPTCLDAIKLDGVVGIRIIGNELSSEAIGGYAVNMVDSERNMIIGNDFASGDNRTNGVHIDVNSDMNVIDSNHFEGLTQGIVSLSISQNVVSSNLFTNISSTEINTPTSSKIVQKNNQGDDIITNSDTPIRVFGGTQFVSASEAPLAGISLTNSQFRFTDAAGTDTSSHHTDGTIRSATYIQLGSFTDASASCVSVTSDRVFGDKDCANVKDSGEEFLDALSVREFAFTAASMEPLTVSTTVASLVKDTGTNTEQLVRSYDDSTTECAGGNIKVPSDTASGATVTILCDSYSGTATTGDFVIDMRHTSGDGDNESWDSTLTTQPITTETVAGTVDLLTFSTTTVLLSTLGWVADDDVQVFFCRDGSNANDSLIGNLSVKGCYVKIPPQ